MSDSELRSVGDNFHAHRRHDDDGGLTLNERLRAMEARQAKLETLVTDLRLEMRGVMVKMWLGSTLFAAVAAGIVEALLRK